MRSTRCSDGWQARTDSKEEPVSRFGVFRINGVDYDLDDLTLDEVEQIEDLNDGLPFGELRFNSAKAMKSIAFTMIRRAQPELRIEDVGSVKLIDFLAPEEEMPDLPTEETEESPSGSAPDGSGTRLSAVSTRG